MSEPRHRLPVSTLRQSLSPIRLGVALAAMVLTYAALDSVYVLRADQDAVVVRLGRPIVTLNATSADDAGLKLKWPFVDRVIRFDRRELGVEAEPIEAITADGRPVLVDAFLHYRVHQPLKVYQAVGDAKSATERLGEVLNAVVRQSVARAAYASLLGATADAALQQAQASVSAEARAEGLGVEIVDVGLSHLDPTPPEAQAIIHRMQAAQTAEAAAIRATGEQRKQQLMALADKDAGVIRATAIGQSEAIWGQGDAGRADIFAKAYAKDPDFAHFYQAMHAYEAALGDKQTTLILSPSSAFFQAFQKGPAPTR
jgi:membrane protease subunit HflC